MFEKILLATDGSKQAGEAARAAMELARALPGAEVRVIYVRVEPPTRREALEAQMDVHAVVMQEAEEVTGALIEEMGAAGITCELVAGLGDPADKIVTYAKKEAMDLIVIGNRGRGSVSSLLLGSVSQRVAHEAGCPVMVVK